jgi:arabinogalactan oligomer / maltooligosaccharide transport system substrate-binding protein
MSKPPGRQYDRRAFARRILGASLATLLGACAAPATPAATPVGTGSSVATLILWHGWAGASYQALSQLVESFNRQHSHGRIVLQSIPLTGYPAELLAATRAGSGPHLALFPNTWLGTFAATNSILAIDEIISPAELSDILPTALGGASISDTRGQMRLYGVPLSFDTIALAYNSSNLLAVPADTNALFSSARGLSAPDANPPIWGFAVNLSLDTTIGYLYAFEGRIFDDQGALVLGSSGRDGAERWLNWVYQLSIDQRMYARPDSNIAVDYELRSGHVLSTFDWAHGIERYRRAWDTNLAVAPLPRLAETGLLAKPYVRSDILAINARASEPELSAARDFLRFMIGETAQRALLQANLQPSRSLAFEQQDSQAAIVQAFRSQADQGQPMPHGVERSIVEQELRLMQQQVVNGLASAGDAVSETEQRLSQRLRRITE